jgi:Flp pilus assembly protein TadD
LVALYQLPYQLNPWELRYVLSYLAVIGGAVAVIVFRRRLPSLVAATVVYVVTVAPVLGFAQSGPQFVADRYSYVCCIGWALMAGGGLFALWSSRRFSARGIAGGLAAVVVLAALFVLTTRQTRVWHDSKTLWSHALAVGRPSSTAHLNFGIHLREEDKIDEAIRHYQAAIRLRPDCGETHFALANALKAQKRWPEAEASYRQAVRFMAEKHRAYLNLGNMYYNDLRRRDDAAKAYRAAIDYIEATPPRVFSPLPYLALGVALKAAGDVDGARMALEVARQYRKTRKRALEELATLGAERP